MIHQLLVVDPSGPCVLDRTYHDDSLDPHLMSAFLAAVLPRMDELGFTSESVSRELNKSEIKTYIDYTLKDGWIIVAISDKPEDRDKVKDVVDAIGTAVVKMFGVPEGYSIIESETLSTLEMQIDMIISQKGISAVSKSSSSGIVPILSKVYKGDIKPKKAAKLILESIKDGNYNAEGLKNLKKSLEMLDSMIPKEKKLDSFTEIIRSTYKGVSRMIVRMDNALAF